MQLREIRRLVDSTSDSAFAVDATSRIVAWNKASEALFGLPATGALDKRCGEVVQGIDECGPVCSADCTVQQAVRKRHAVSNFDLQVHTAKGRRWCNVSVLIADESSSMTPYAIHIVRQIDLRKRLEILMRDFVVAGTGMPAEHAMAIISSMRSPAKETELSRRELDILRLLAKGVTTTEIARQLHISRTTVSNHIRHILRKLNAHTRLEAVRRAERAGLI